MINKNDGWNQPFGDGTSGIKIVEELYNVKL
jgi:hypothetical protein